MSLDVLYLQNRIWQRDFRDRRGLEPDYTYALDTVPPSAVADNCTNAVTTKYVKSATNKMRCPIFCMAWTPEGRRLVTGASSGEFTLWNGLTFNFETILQAHDSPVRSMIWSHNDIWMVTADHGGYVKYWQSNMNNVKMFQVSKKGKAEQSRLCFNNGHILRISINRLIRKLSGVCPSALQTKSLHLVQMMVR